MARVKRNAATATTLPPKPGGKNRRSNPLKLTGPLNVRGRPPVYKEEFDELARRAYLLGYEDGEVADLLGISISVLNVWLKTHESFLNARAKGKHIADMEVAESLRQRALGFKHKAEKIMLGPGGQVIREEYTQHYPPDTKAAELWLTNRQSKFWKDRRVVENTGEVGVKIVVTGGLPEDDETEE